MDEGIKLSAFAEINTLWLKHLRIAINYIIAHKAQDKARQKKEHPAHEEEEKGDEVEVVVDVARESVSHSHTSIPMGFPSLFEARPTDLEGTQWMTDKIQISLLLFLQEFKIRGRFHS